MSDFLNRFNKVVLCKFLFLSALIAVMFTACEAGDDEDPEAERERERESNLVITRELFPDVTFMWYCLEHFDINDDGLIDETESKAVTSLIMDEKEDNNLRGISTYKGIEWFTNLTELKLPNSYHYSIELDLSKNTRLIRLDCSDNRLSLDVSKNINLVELVCNNSALTYLDLSNNPNLVSVYCMGNNFTELDITDKHNIREIYCASNQLTRLNVSNNPRLSVLVCPYNELTSLDISTNTNLGSFDCRWNNLLTEIYVWNGFDVNNPPADFQKDNSATYVVKP
jgi:hypothetical protein